MPPRQMDKIFALSIFLNDQSLFAIFENGYEILHVKNDESASVGKEILNVMLEADVCRGWYQNQKVYYQKENNGISPMFSPKMKMPFFFFENSEKMRHKISLLFQIHHFSHLAYKMMYSLN